MNTNEVLNKLIAEVERLKPRLRRIGGKDVLVTTNSVYKKLDRIIDFARSLQQEQPGVDLEKEIDNVLADYSFTKTIDSGGFKTTILDYPKIARHFFELGRARKEEVSIPSNLDEAAEKYANNLDYYHYTGDDPAVAFKAGAEWQKEHDHDFCLTCEKNRDVVFHKGMQYAIEQMKKDAIELPVKIDAGGYPYIQITGIEFFDYDKDTPTAKEGDVVRILILNGND